MAHLAMTGSDRSIRGTIVARIGGVGHLIILHEIRILRLDLDD